jgi:hypothetical protein
MDRIVGTVLVFLLLSAWIDVGYAEGKDPGKLQSPDTTRQDSGSHRKTSIQVKYGDKGWEFSTPDGKYVLQFQSRLQFRYAVPGDTDPLTYDDFEKDRQNIFKINRARLKIGGNVYQPWLKYYWEYELASGNLLDFRMMLEKLPYLKLKVGQWKGHFNRERVISSGQQQMVERSLISTLTGSG